MIVVDIETSGVDPVKNSILSVGAVDFSRPEDQFYEECRLREGSSYDQVSLEIAGFTVEQINDSKKKSLEELLKNFLKWTENINDITLAGHNIQFDVRFLDHSFRLYGMRWIFGYRSVDTHTLVYAQYLSRGLDLPSNNNRSAITSDIVFNYVGLPDEKRPHNGLNGAKMEAESISRLFYGKNLLSEYSGFKIPEYLLFQK